MRDTWIVLLTALLMLCLTLGGQYLSGGFSVSSGQYAAVETDMEGWAVQEGKTALINVNRADAETLNLVDGIGETLSQRIVAYREEHGPFQSLDELTGVSGIGKGTLERIRPRLTVGAE